MTFDWQAGGGGSDTSFRGKSRSWICDKPGRARALTANKVQAVAYQCLGSNVGEMGTLRSGNQGVTGGVPFVAVDLQNTAIGGDVAGTPDTTRPGRGGGQAVMAYGGNNPDALDVATACNAKGGAGRMDFESETFVTPPMGVRRLTPREMERLQGFPDCWTLLPVALRKPIEDEYAAYLATMRPDLTREELERLSKDGPRAKALGNSMAVPVLRWIGERIVLIDAARTQSPR
jgi:site-specific DNA-cytosine methylase